MPELDKTIQDSFWKLADMLAVALSAGDKDNPPDPDWSVSGLGQRGWKVDHPDLPLVSDKKGAKRDVLLQLHVDWNPQAKKWFVLAQNLVNLPFAANHGTLVVAQQDDPPGQTWPMQQIVRDASRYFWDQKKQLVDAAQQLSPSTPPGQGVSGKPPAGADAAAGGAAGGMGAMGGMMASRRARLAREILRRVEG